MKHRMIDLQICSPRVSGARGAFLRVVTHPFSGAFLGFLVMIQDGAWAALVGALLASIVAWWAWSAQGRADRAGKALVGAANIVMEWVSRRRAQHVETRAALRRHLFPQELDISRARLGVYHPCLAPRLTPTPILTRASG